MANIIQVNRSSSGLNSPKEIMANAAQRRQQEQILQQRSDEAWMQNLMQQAEMYKDPRQKKEYLQQVLSSPEARERMQRVGMVDPSAANVAPSQEMLAADAVSQGQIGAMQKGGRVAEQLITGTKTSDDILSAQFGTETYGPEAGRRAWETSADLRQSAHEEATSGETRRNHVVMEGQTAPVNAARADYYTAGAGRQREQATNLRDERNPDGGIVTGRIRVKEAGGDNPQIKAAQQTYDSTHKTYLALLDKSLSMEPAVSEPARAALNEIAPRMKQFSEQLQRLYASLGTRPPQHVVDPKTPPPAEQMELEDDDPEGLF